MVQAEAPPTETQKKRRRFGSRLEGSRFNRSNVCVCLMDQILVQISSAWSMAPSSGVQTKAHDF